MGERGRRLDSGYNQKSDRDNSQSDYSDDEHCRVSDYLPPISTTNTEGRSQKAQKLKTLLHYQASKHPACKFAPSKTEMCRSVNRESSLIELPSLAAKRLLAAHQLKIHQLHNELTEVHLKLEEQLKENRSLKQLQYKQEKIIQKFEEHDVSHLLARHREEIRVQKALLRRSQENQQTTERKLRTVEDELCKTKDALQKVTQIAEERELPLRKELTKKVASLQSKLEESEHKIQNLEKKIHLNTKSFQRQLLSERKKSDEAQEINKSLQEEIQQLNNKLKDKERRLEATNIDAYRMSKPPPRKDIKITPGKKAVTRTTKREQQTATGVQTSGYFCPVEFPPPPDLISDPVSEENKDLHIKTDKERRLEATNIDAYRKSNPSPREDIKITPSKKEWKREEAKRRENKAKMGTEKEGKIFSTSPEIDKQDDLTFGSYAPSIGKGYRRPRQFKEHSDVFPQDKRQKPT